MENKIYQEFDEAHREKMMEDMCRGTEEQLVKKHFSPEEITDFRKQLSDNHVVIRKAIEALNLAKAEFNEATKGAVKENLTLVNNIRCGYIQVNQQVYLFDDQDNGVMNYYDRLGEFLQSRRLLPEERQTRIK